MKKIILASIIFFSSCLPTFSDISGNTVNRTGNSLMRECGTTTSHTYLHNGVIPNSSVTPAIRTGGSTACTTYSFHPKNNYNLPSSGYYTKGTSNTCAIGERVVTIMYYNGAALVSTKNIGDPEFAGAFTRYIITCSKYDDTPPTVGISLGGYTSNTRVNTNVATSITCSDAGSDCNASSYQYRISASPFTCNDGGGTRTTSGSHLYSVAAGSNIVEYICYRGLDNVGLGYSYSSPLASDSPAIIKIDKIIPSVSSDYAFSGVRSRSGTVTINFTGSDTGGSLFRYIRYCDTGAGCFPNTTAYTISRSAPYNQVINYKSWDYATNQSVTGSITVMLDDVAPTITGSTIDASGTTYTGARTNKNINVNIGCADITSGCRSITYQYRRSSTPFTCNDGGGTRNSLGGTTYTYTPPAGTGFIDYICFRGSDNAGNVGYEPSIHTIKYDNIKPTNLYTYPFAGWQNLSTYTVVLTGSDSHSQIKNFNWCEWSGCNPDAAAPIGHSGTIITQNSIYNNTINYKIWDNAGNFTTGTFVMMLNGPIITAPVKDNDSDARSQIIGYITNTGSYENIFWNNQISSDYIENNTNNSDGAYSLIGDITQGYLNIGFNNSCKIRVVVYDKERYSRDKELFVLDSFEGNVSAGTGYIVKSGNNLSISGSYIGAYQFDFTNNDYAVFVQNNGPGILNYKLTGLYQNNGIYINPIDDSYPKEIRMLVGHIVISNGVYIGKQTEYIKLK